MAAMNMNLQQLANELEEMRITTLIDVCACCEPQYQDYLGKILNEQFRELSQKLGLSPHTTTTAATMYRNWFNLSDNDAAPTP